MVSSVGASLTAVTTTVKVRVVVFNATVCRAAVIGHRDGDDGGARKIAYRLCRKATR